MSDKAKAMGEAPAMPAWEFGGQGPEPVHFGLTKRELFAAMAMHGILAGRNPVGILDSVTCAKNALFHADALLKELSR